MKNNLYIFAIGGSGERVMYSFLMYMIAGVKVDAKTVIPVFVDNDVDSCALQNCINLIKAYRDPEKSGVHNLYVKTWGTDTAAWPSFCSQEIAEPVILNINGTEITNLENIIDSNLNVGQSQKDLLENVKKEKELLFSSLDLQMPLSVGFVGHPNIGSIVLNALSFEMSAFKNDILNKVTSNDAVFVIGSIYGGTGAAGFPLIVNKFSELTNKHRPMIGGSCILPYFSTVRSEQSEDANIIDTSLYDVQSGAFYVKSRAALMYYDVYMKDKMDYLYYVGDNKLSKYTHCVGGENQDNPANLVELMSALSIVDFCKSAKPSSIVYKQPIWGFLDDCISSNVSGIPDPDLKKAIVKFQIMKVMFENKDFLHFFITSGRQNFVANIGFTDSVRAAVVGENGTYAYAEGLKFIFDSWNKWTLQLENRHGASSRTFMIFNNTDVLRNNITSKFYSDNSEFGIAKTEQRGLINRHLEAVDPKIGDALNSAYRDLFPNGSLDDASNVKEIMKLPYELQIISKALDSVIENKCDLTK